MKFYSQIVQEQKKEVIYLRSLVDTLVATKIEPHPAVMGVLLTGSVSRGDARVGPYGLFIDVAIVVKEKKNLDLKALLGPDEQPSQPFHCVTIDGKIGLAVEVVEYQELLNLRSKDDSVLYAKWESTILVDKEGLLKTWMTKIFTLSDEEVGKRSLIRLRRVGYLIGEYRMEKWSKRGAWIQLCQNQNEAVENFCEFIYCANGLFVPRKDWLVYLTFEQALQPPNLEGLIQRLYKGGPDRESVDARHRALLEAYEWMLAISKTKGWN